MAATFASNAVNAVKGEIHNVLSIIRMNRRWASDERFRREVPLHHETPLIRSFKTLLNHLQHFDDLGDVDVVLFLQPFLQVVESTDTSGPLTGIALQSVNKFLIYRFLREESPRVREGANRIAHAVNHCRFESSSAADDEATLLSLLEVTENVVRGDCGRFLTDANVWQLVRSCHRIAHMPAASQLLHRGATSTLSNVLLALFSRLPELVGAEGEGTPEAGAGEGAAPPPPTAPSTAPAPVAVDILQHRRPLQAPYGVPVLVRILRWLARMTDMGRLQPPPPPGGKGAPPPDAFDMWAEEEEEALPEGADTAAAKRARCTAALRLINVILETAGAELGQAPELVQAAQVDVCKHLVANSRTSDLQTLSLTLRVVFNLFIALKSHLKVQLEVFFTSVHLHLADARTSSPEHRELALESLLEFCREPALMLDLYVNYDCDVMCTNLFEVLVGALCRNTLPGDGPLTSLNITALEGVLAVIDNIHQGCAAQVAAAAAVDDGHGPTTAAATTAAGGEGDGPSSLRQRKQLKRKMQLAAARFNGDSNPSKSRWVPYVQEVGLLPEPASARDIAAFLRTCSGLDTTLVGDYLSQPPEDKFKLNTAVCKEYIASFNFQGMRVDDALRLFLEDFRLPGESQKISRLMEALSETLFEQSPGPLENPDAAFILAYAIIMLNTDLHNPQVSRKMTLAGFNKQLKGVNGGADLPAEYTAAIYDAIKNRQIRMRMDVNSLTASAATEDHGLAMGSAWDGVLARAGAVSAFTSAVASAEAAEHQRDMFGLIADAALGALTYVWAHSADQLVLRRVLRGFFQVSAITSHYGMGDILNGLVTSLARYWLKAQPAAMADFQPAPGLLALPGAFLALDAPRRDGAGGGPRRARADSTVSSVDDSSAMDTPGPGEWEGGEGGAPAAPPPHTFDMHALASGSGGVAGGGGSPSPTAAWGRRARSSVGSSSSALPRPALPKAEAWRVQHSDALPSTDHLDVHRSLLTLRCVLLLARSCGGLLREGWRAVLDVVHALQGLQALPLDFLQMDDPPGPDGSALPSVLHQDTRLVLPEAPPPPPPALAGDPVPPPFQLRPASVATAAKLQGVGSGSVGAGGGGKGEPEAPPPRPAPHAAPAPSAAKPGMWGMVTNLLLGGDDEAAWSPEDLFARSLRFEAWRCRLGDLFRAPSAKLPSDGVAALLKACMTLGGSHAPSTADAQRSALGGELVASLVVWNTARPQEVWSPAVAHWGRLLTIASDPEEVAATIHAGAKGSVPAHAAASPVPGASPWEGGGTSPRDGQPRRPLALRTAHHIAFVYERCVVNALRSLMRLLIAGEAEGPLPPGSDAQALTLVDAAALPVLRLLAGLPPSTLALVAPRVAGGLTALLPILRQVPTGPATWHLLWSTLLRCQGSFFAAPAVLEGLTSSLVGAGGDVRPWAAAVVHAVTLAKGQANEAATAGAAAAVALLTAPPPPPTAQAGHSLYTRLAKQAFGKPLADLHASVTGTALRTLCRAVATLPRLLPPQHLPPADASSEAAVAALRDTWRQALAWGTAAPGARGSAWHEPPAMPQGDGSAAVRHVPWSLPDSAWAFLVAQLAGLLTCLWTNAQVPAGTEGEGEGEARPLALPPPVRASAVAGAVAALAEVLSAPPTPASPSEAASSLWQCVLQDTLLPLAVDCAPERAALPPAQAAHLRMEITAVLVRTFLRVGVSCTPLPGHGACDLPLADLWEGVLTVLVRDVCLVQGGGGGQGGPWPQLLSEGSQEAVKNMVLVGTSQGWLRTGQGQAEGDPSDPDCLAPPPLTADGSDLWTTTVGLLTEHCPELLASLGHMLPEGALPGIAPGQGGAQSADGGEEEADAAGTVEGGAADEQGGGSAQPGEAAGGGDTPPPPPPPPPPPAQASPLPKESAEVAPPLPGAGGEGRGSPPPDASRGVDAEGQGGRGATPPPPIHVPLAEGGKAAAEGGSSSEEEEEEEEEGVVGLFSALFWGGGQGDDPVE